MLPALAAPVLAASTLVAAQAQTATLSQAAQLAAATTTPGTISTIAGGVGGPATATTVALGLGTGACGVAYGNSSLYIADTSTVRQVNPATDWLTTPAGTGSSGPRGNGGPAAKASLESCAVAIDRHGNLVIADFFNNQVRVVAAATGTYYGKSMTAGDIYRVAGNGTAGYVGDRGPATRAELDAPQDVAVDGAGNLVVADTQNERVRVVAVKTGTFYGKAMTAGDIYTVAGNGIQGFSGNRGPAVKAELNEPWAVAVDHAGNLVIADTHNNRVRVVAVKTGTFYGKAMTAGDIYTVAGNGTAGYSGDGGPATSAELDRPEGVAVDSTGNLVIADAQNDRVRVLTG